MSTLLTVAERIAPRVWLCFLFALFQNHFSLAQEPEVMGGVAYEKFMGCSGYGGQLHTCTYMVDFNAAGFSLQGAKGVTLKVGDRVPVSLAMFFKSPRQIIENEEYQCAIISGFKGHGWIDFSEDLIKGKLQLLYSAGSALRQEGKERGWDAYDPRAVDPLLVFSLLERVSCGESSL